MPESHHQDLSDPIYEAMQLLYQQPEVLDTIKRRAEYQLNDSAEYFFDSLKRMRNPDYMRRWPNRNVRHTVTRSKSV